MTFSTQVPVASQSPQLFPAQANVNFTRLKTIINADHVFNDSTQTTDGVHRQVTLINRATPVSLPVGTNGIMYSFLDGAGQTQLRFYNGNTDVQITGSNILAMVNFNGISGAVIRKQFNVSSITRLSTGKYKLTFTNSLPNTNYIVTFGGMRDQEDLSVGCVTGDSTYGNSVKTNELYVSFYGSTSSERDVFMGNIVIFGVT